MPQDKQRGAASAATPPPSVGSTHEAEDKRRALLREAEQMVEAALWRNAAPRLAELEARRSALPAGPYPELDSKIAQALSVIRQNVEAHADALRRRKEVEAICAAAEALAAAAAPGREAEMADLEARWAARPEVAPEFMEILLKRFEDARSLFHSRLRQAAELAARKAAAAGRVEPLLAAARELAAAEPGPQTRLEAERLSAQAARLAAECPGLLDAETQLVASLAAEALAKERAASEAAEAAARQADAAFQAIADAMAALAEDEAGAKDNRTRAAELKAKWEEAAASSGRPAPREARKKYESALHKFQARLRSLFEAEDLQRWENYTLKLDLCSRIEALAAQPDDARLAKENKALFDQWRAIGPVPREKQDELWSRFNSSRQAILARCDAFFERLRASQEAARARKAEINARAAALESATEWNAASDELKALQAEWKSLAQLPRAEEEAAFAAFRKSCDAFFLRRNQRRAELAAAWERNRAAKAKLCEAAEALAARPPGEAMAELKALRAAWKEIGFCGKADEQPLASRFDAAAARVAEAAELLKPENLRVKRGLAEAVAAIVAEARQSTDFHPLTERIKEAQALWERTGPVPAGEDQPVWTAYKSALDEFYALRAAHMDRLRAEREENMRLKQALLAKVEALAASSGDWAAAAEEVKALQAEWKSIGPAPKESEQSLWESFHAACDSIFNHRREYFKRLDEERAANLRRKLDLCVRAEKIAGAAPAAPIGGAANLAAELVFAMTSNIGSASSRPRTREDIAAELKALQAEWRRIGSGPFKEDREVYRRFRAVCDAFFGDRHHAEE